LRQTLIGGFNWGLLLIGGGRNTHECVNRFCFEESGQMPEQRLNLSRS